MLCKIANLKPINIIFYAEALASAKNPPVHSYGWFAKFKVSHYSMKLQNGTQLALM